MDIELQAKFIQSWVALEDIAEKTAREHGWWDKPRNDGELIALMHSELSEALEFLRHDNPPSDHIPDYSGVEEELADVVIRIMDFAAARDLALPQAILAKMAYNATRPAMQAERNSKCR